MRVRKVLASVLLGGMLAVTGAHAAPGPHTATGTGVNSTLDVFAALSASEATQSGSVIINGITVTIFQVCVPGPTPAGYHKMQAAGFSTVPAMKWYIEIGDSPSGDAAGYLNAVTTTCGFWPIGASTVVAGGFSITP